MFKEGQTVRFIKAHGSMNKHLKACEGETAKVICDSYSYGKTLVQFLDAKLQPIFSINNDRLSLIDTNEN